MAYSATRSIVDDLEYQVEYWRQRAESAEAALCGNSWNTAVPPLTLQQTRLMRLLARRPMSAAMMLDRLQGDYESFTDNGLKAALCYCRKRLPDHIAPQRCVKHGSLVDVLDRAALREFLGEDS